MLRDEAILLERRELQPEERYTVRFFTFNCVRTYIELDRGAKDEYDELLTKKENRKMRGKIVTWQEQMETKGRLEALRTVALRLLKRRFGRLPSEVRQRISEIGSQEELTRLAERVYEVDSLKELGLA